MLLFLKAVDRRDTHTMSLFAAPVLIDGHVKANGTFVAPYVAKRRHAVESHPAVVASSKLSNNPPETTTGAVVDAELSGIPAAVASLTPGVPVDAAAAPEWRLPNRRDVPEHLVAAVMASIEKVNRRAAKLGVDGFTVTRGKPFAVERKTREGTKYLIEMVPLTIEGGKVKSPNGWSLLGRVDFEDGSTLVSSRPGAEMPPRYRMAAKTCDHCQADRQRNAIFVFNKPDTEEHMQVGRSCLQDFLGYDPAATLWAAREYGGIFDDIDGMLDDDERQGGGGQRHAVVRLDEVMTAAAYAVRHFGFVSKRAAEERGTTPTSDDVGALLFDPKAREDYKPADVDTAKAAAVVAWVQSEWGGKSDLSDYEYNAIELTSRETVRPRRIGILTSLVAAYDRANEEKVAREKRVNAHVGEVGQRREFDAVFSGLSQFDTQFGVMFVARFDSPEGLLVYKGGTIWWPVPLDIGTPIKFVGTIKEHADYKGTKQTMVSRCALPKEKPVKAKKAAAVPA